MSSRMGKSTTLLNNHSMVKPQHRSLDRGRLFLNFTLVYRNYYTFRDSVSTETLLGGVITKSNIKMNVFVLFVIEPVLGI